MPPRITGLPTTGGGGGGGGDVTTSYTTGDATYTTGHAAMFAFKQLAVASGGYVCEKTCTGAAFSAGTDLLTTAAAMNAAGVFFVLRADSGQQFLFRRGSDSRKWTCDASASGFTGGGVGTPPTQSDGGVTINGATGPFATAGDFDSEMGVEEQAPWRWWIRSQPGSSDDDECWVSAGTAARPVLFFAQGGQVGNWFASTNADIFTMIQAMLQGTAGTTA